MQANENIDPIQVDIEKEVKVESLLLARLTN